MQHKRSHKEFSASLRRPEEYSQELDDSNHLIVNKRYHYHRCDPWRPVK